MDVNRNKMSETDIKMAIRKSIARVEKSISDNTESLREEMRSNQGEHTNAMNEMQSKLETLTPRVNKA